MLFHEQESSERVPDCGRNARTVQECPQVKKMYLRGKFGSAARMSLPIDDNDARTAPGIIDKMKKSTFNRKKHAEASLKNDAVVLAADSSTATANGDDESHAGEGFSQVELGHRLRTARRERKLTLQQLSRQ